MLTVAELRAVFKGDTTNLDAALTKVGKSGDQMKKVGVGFTAGVTLPLIGAGFAAVKTEADFSSTMAQMAVASGAPKPQLESLRSLAVKTGKDTVFSANEAATAMLELAKGGMTAAQVKGGALAGTVALAATENMNLADAATVVVNSLAQFDMKASQASKVADALAAGSIASTASVSSLSQGLQQVGPAAKNAGLDLFDTVGALAMFDANALKGADAGTSLKTMLAKLVPSTSKASDAMKALGLDFTKSNGEFKSFPAIAKEMQKGFAGLSAEERVKAINTIFGSDAQRAANILIDEGAKGLTGYITATKKQGAAQKMADAAMSGTKGAIESMMGSLETAALRLGVAMAPAVHSVAEKVSWLADGFTDLSPSMQTGVAVAGLMLAALGPLLMIFGPMITTLAALRTAHLAHTAAVAAGTATTLTSKIVTAGQAVASGAAAVATGVWTAAQWLLNAALTANPIGLVVVAIAALVGGLIIAYKKSETFRKVVDGALGAVKDAAVAVKNWFAESFVPFWTDTLPGAFAATRDWVKDKWHTVKGFVTDPILAAKTRVGELWDDITGKFTAAKDWVLTTFAPLWAAIGAVLTDPVGSAKTVLGNLFGPDGPIRGALSGVRDWVVDTFKAGWAALGAILTDPVGSARDVFWKLLGPEGPIRSAFSAAVDAIGLIWDGLKTAAAVPVRFVVDTIYNNGIRSMVNALPGVPNLPEIDLAFAAGGPVTGGTRGKDSVRAWLMPGEHVWTDAEVRAAGGHSAMYALRRSVRRGELGRGFDPAFAEGGALSPQALMQAQHFAKAQAGKPYQWGGVGPSGYDCSGFMSAITNFLRGQPPHARLGSTGTFPWPGFRQGTGQFTIGSSPSYSGGVGHMAGTLGNMNVESRGGDGVVVGAGARGYGDSGFSQVYHLGSAGAGGGGGGLMDAVKAVKEFLGKLSGWVRELAGMGGWGGMMKQMVAGVLAGLRDWVNGKVPGPGPIPGGSLFDSGGWLMPGVPVNRTGRPEAVLTPEESAAFVDLVKRYRGGTETGVQVTQNVHPSAGMDEQQVAEVAASRLVATLATMGGMP